MELSGFNSVHDVDRVDTACRVAAATAGQATAEELLDPSAGRMIYDMFLKALPVVSFQQVPSYVLHVCRSPRRIRVDLRGAETPE